MEPVRSCVRCPERSTAGAHRTPNGSKVLVLALNQRRWPKPSRHQRFKSCGYAKLRRRQHAEEVCRQRPARMPVLEAHGRSRDWIELAQPCRDLLGDDVRGVVVLKAQPRDVGLRVVVANDLHVVQASAGATR